MGDRCYLRMEILVAELPKWNKIFSRGHEPKTLLGWVDEPKDMDEVDPDDPGLEVTVEEANYAWDTELREAAKMGLTFAGWHESGGEYPAGRFAGVGGRYDEVETSNDGDVVVRLSSGYKPVGISAIKRAEAHIAKAEKALENARASVRTPKTKKTKKG